MKKGKIACMLLAAVLLANVPAGAGIPSSVVVAEAHGGRTDASGGHHDNKNKSGLGSYHYHCGGHPAHLHTNGMCPYVGGSASSTSSSGASASASGSTTAAAQSGAVTVPDHIERVFDASYYADHNQDLKNLYGTDREKLLNHFLTSGMKEGRQAAECFNLSVYKDSNPDLVTVLGDDNEAYYMHYIQSGCDEGRTAC